MERSFNAAGPCRASRHYMLPPLQRLPQLRTIIDRQHYVVVHAPRQAGKTTSLTALASSLTAEGTYAAVLVTAEVGAALDDIGAATPARAWRGTVSSWLGTRQRRR